MYDMSEIRKGLKIKLDGHPYTIIEFQFVKPGKGQSFTRTRVKNMITGNVIDRTFKSNERLEPADLEDKQMQYLYPEGDAYVFMDTTTYEQLHLQADNLGDARFFLTDNTMVDVLFYDGRAIGVTPPIFVELKVVETEPGFKGDTSSNATKPAKLESGLQVQVPLFVNEGEYLKIDTRSGAYVERVKK